MAEEKSGGIPSIQNRVTIDTLHRMKREGKIFVASSIYDADDARFSDEAGVEVIVVGDSAAMAIGGRPNTLTTTMNKMLRYAEDVCRGTSRIFVIGDMPLGTYPRENKAVAVSNALRFMQEVGDRTCNAVKIEISMKFIGVVEAIAAECLVVAHIGLNPNKAEMLGGYRLVNKTKDGAMELIKTAIAAEGAGACMILIESVPEEVSQTVREIVKIPVLGIAAGRGLDGQLTISSDMLGKYKWPGNKIPNHFKQYRISRVGHAAGENALKTLQAIMKKIKRGKFPNKLGIAAGENALKTLRAYTTEAEIGFTVGEATLEAFRVYVAEIKSGKFPGENNVHFLPKKDRREVEGYLRRRLKRGRFDELRAKYPRPRDPDPINLATKELSASLTK